jgi:hypothetical protein
MSWKLVDRSRSALANGMSVIGIQCTLEELYKSAHLVASEKWSLYVNWRHKNPIPLGEQVKWVEFFLFTDWEYAGAVPSCAFIILVVVEDIKS